MFENRKYIIVATSDLNQIDFTQVLQTSIDTVRKSVDGTLSLLKYEGEIPSSIAPIESKSQEYTHEEILEVLATEQWTFPMREEM